MCEGYEDYSEEIVCGTIISERRAGFWNCGHIVLVTREKYVRIVTEKQ